MNSKSVRMPHVVMYVIYRNPADYPGCFVVRRWVGMEPDKYPLCITADYATALLTVPHGLFNLGQQAGDDPVIFAVWV